MRLLLDSHVLLWAQALPDVLGPKTVRRLLDERNDICLSVISVLELTRLAEMGRVQVKLSLDEWLERSLRTLQAQLLPVDTEVALEAARLPEPQPPDVADRILLATARVHDCELVTADDGLLAQTAARLRDARL